MSAGHHLALPYQSVRDHGIGWWSTDLHPLLLLLSVHGCGAGLWCSGHLAALLVLVSDRSCGAVWDSLLVELPPQSGHCYGHLQNHRAGCWNDNHLTLLLFQSVQWCGVGWRKIDHPTLLVLQSVWGHRAGWRSIAQHHPLLYLQSAYRCVPGY